MDSSEVWDGNIEGQIYASGSLLEEAWLAQANHIFHRLGITSNHNDYVLHPPGYLFLCALEDLQADSPSRFRLSECPAYWSLDPTGDERLSVEEAERLGFPNPEFKMEVRGWSWDERVYNGSRQFYQAKGFDPESQDIARELGLPLFEISTEVDGPFAHIEETDVCDHRSGIQNIPDSEVLQPVAHGESGLHFPPDQRVASSSTPAPQMFSFGAHVQGSAIDESFDPCFFESSTPSARSSHNFSFNFEFPFHDQPYYLPPLESSSRSQFTPFAVAGSSINLLGPSGMQFTTPPPSLWTSFPHLPPIPAPPPPPCLPTDPVAAHLESGSGKRKSRDDDPAEDINIHAWRPRKMATRADLWGV
ncbi:hypothetical protein B0H17DRAFT_1096524 [Mycena rosella]|uniref:Uncharacterized protein n=1 Tax=Mycena rosella TaxID=1033263 RepID=A0AAD7CR57_MYCRO|nr:hypothetical protein B0H17DRAFT_1096524 [Mycena rosella]